MTKLQFLYELDDKLSGLPEEDRERSIEYYSEIIDDRIEEGLSEEEAVKALGSVDYIASQTISEIPLPRLIKERFKVKRSLRVWEIILLAFGFLIIGIPIIAALFSIAVTLIASIFAVAVSFIAIPVALLGTGVGGIIAFFPIVFSGDVGIAFFILGCSILALGLSVPFFYIAKYAMKLAVLTVKGIVLLIKKSFVRRK